MFTAAAPRLHFPACLALRAPPPETVNDADLGRFALQRTEIIFLTQKKFPHSAF